LECEIVQFLANPVIYSSASGTPVRKEDRAKVTILVNDVNDEPPQFAHERYVAFDIILLHCFHVEDIDMVVKFVEISSKSTAERKESQWKLCVLFFKSTALTIKRPTSKVKMFM
jgi:hypothetical protein